MEWILIIWIFAYGDASWSPRAIALESISGFISEKQCEEAGQRFSPKYANFRCVVRGPTDIK
jgi:hypothetical protein